MKPTIAYDFETHRFEPGWMAPPPICLAWADADGSRGIEIDDSRMRDLFLYGLEEQLVNQTIAFDLAVGAAAWPDALAAIFDALDAGRVHCVETRQKLIDNAHGHLRGYYVDADEDEELRAGLAVAKRRKPRRIDYRLATTADRLLGVKLNKGEDSWQLRYAELVGVPLSQWPEDAIRYPIDDAVTALACSDAQEQSGAQWLASEPEQVQAAFALRLASNWGLRTDGPAVERLRESVVASIAQVEEKLAAIGLVHGKQKARNTKRAKELVVQAIALTGIDPRVTNGGDVSLAGGFLKELSGAVRETNPELASALADYTALSAWKKVLSTDVPMLEAGVTLPIHTRFEHLQATGRASSSKPNVMNIRRVPGIREGFVPRAGNAFVACDYAMLELCTLAQVCWDLFGFSNLREVLNSGRDAHLHMAARLLGWAYEDALAAYRVEKKLPKDAPKPVSTMRQTAKPIMFGLPGGMGARALVAYARNYGVDLDDTRAAELKRAWLAEFPEMTLYFAEAQRAVEEDGGFVWLPRVHFARTVDYFTEACNTPFQGLGAAIAKAACYDVTKGCYLYGYEPRLFGCRLVNFVHDELILEAPIDRVHEAGEALSEVMLRQAKVRLPDVNIEASSVAMMRWSKDAARVVDANGRLIPWEAA